MNPAHSFAHISSLNVDLIKKGLRHGLLGVGLQTEQFERRPDEEGIKTAHCVSVSHWMKCLNVDLIKKGLRLIAPAGVERVEMFERRPD